MKFQKAYKKIIISEQFFGTAPYEEKQNPQLQITVTLEEIPLTIKSLPGQKQLADVKGQYKIVTNSKDHSVQDYGILNDISNINKGDIVIYYKENNATDFKTIDFTQLNKEDQAAAYYQILSYFDDPTNYIDEYYEQLQKLNNDAIDKYQHDLAEYTEKTKENNKIYNTYGFEFTVDGKPHIYHDDIIARDLKEAKKQWAEVKAMIPFHQKRVKLLHIIDPNVNPLN